MWATAPYLKLLLISLNEPETPVHMRQDLKDRGVKLLRRSVHQQPSSDEEVERLDHVLGNQLVRRWNRQVGNV